MKVIKASGIPFEAASHEDKNIPHVLKKVLAGRDEFMAGHVQMLNWAHLPARVSFREHYHEDMQEVFIIVSGRVTMKAPGIESILEAGDVAIVPPSTKHKMHNISDTDAQYIVFGITSDEGGKTVVTE